MEGSGSLKSLLFLNFEMLLLLLVFVFVFVLELILVGLISLFEPLRSKALASFSLFSNLGWKLLVGLRALLSLFVF